MIQKNSTIKSRKSGAVQVGAEIPPVTEADYGKRLMLVNWKPEYDETHFIDALDPERPIVCEGPCPLCKAGVNSHCSLLIPVYNVDDDIVKVLRVDSRWNPGSLRVGLFLFLNPIFNRTLTCVCHIPFTISQEVLPPDVIHPCFPEFEDFPLYRLTPGGVRCNFEEIADKYYCVSRFFEDYRYGDLAKSVNVRMHAGELEDSLKLIDVDDYLALASSFPRIIKKVDRVA